MPAIPRSYPLQARLRYAYYEAGIQLPVVENAWWEGRWDGGRALGAVVEAMGHPRTPHRLRVHLRLGPDDTPKEMELTLLRPDGEGQASYRFEPDAVHAGGIWNGAPFSEVIRMPAGYTVAPYCIAADGLHFRSRRETGGDPLRLCYLINPKEETSPLQGRLVTFFADLMGEEWVEVNGQSYKVRQFRSAYAESAAPTADYSITSEGYVLAMTSHRRSGERVEVICDRFEMPPSL